MDAYRWPKFQGGSNDNAACANWLKNTLSLTPRVPRVSYPNTPVNTEPTVFAPIGLEYTLPVPAEYRTTATVMVNWTVRVEGVSEGGVINPWSGAGGWCHPWHGTLDESYVGGQVMTQLFVGGNKLGLPANMTLPDGGVVTSINISDPTISGSYVIKPQDFCPAANPNCSNPQLPAELQLSVQWKNDSCMKVKSQQGFRNMIVTFVPQGAGGQSGNE